jgi:6-phosphogluconate dehydrogenase
MVKAGDAVDDFIDRLTPLLSPGDIILDGGNSHYQDTERRCRALQAKGLLFVGMGVSGGEEGARHGPSIMPGGSAAAWPHLSAMLTAISAKAKGGQPCCKWIGNGGSGHYVKMVHNGIEYADMQLIGEVYQLMRDGLRLSNEQMADVFDAWCHSELDSFLIAITRDILRFKSDGKRHDIDRILDVAGQKGTGKWTVSSALDLGSPATLIAEAVFARGLSAMKDTREAACKTFGAGQRDAPAGFAVAHLKRALYAAKIMAYNQGFALLKKASAEHHWDIDCGSVALMWRGGCIIRSVFLEDIEQAFQQNPALELLLSDAFFTKAILDCQSDWRQTVCGAVGCGIPVPALMAGLSYYDGIRCRYSAANLIQAQRDYFGAHTFQYVDGAGDDPDGGTTGEIAGTSVHLNWTGAGGSTSSSNYTV